MSHWSWVVGHGKIGYQPYGSHSGQRRGSEMWWLESPMAREDQTHDRARHQARSANTRPSTRPSKQRQHETEHATPQAVPQAAPQAAPTSNFSHGLRKGGQLPRGRRVAPQRRRHQRSRRAEWRLVQPGSLRQAELQTNLRLRRPQRRHQRRKGGRRTHHHHQQGRRTHHQQQVR